MIKSLTKSHSLIGNLSWESQLLRLRCQKISDSIMNCNNKDLLSRLHKELSSLEKRRIEIRKIASLLSNKKARLLNKKDCKKIVIYSKKVLFNAIAKGGSSIRDFKNISGTKGNFQKDFKVYQRDGLNCKRFKCIGIIKKKIISNRSTFFCNTCQK